MRHIERQKDDENSSSPFDVGLSGALYNYDKAGLVREGDFQDGLVSCLTPLVFTSSVGYNLKTQTETKTAGTTLKDSRSHFKC